MEEKRKTNTISPTAFPYIVLAALIVGAGVGLLGNRFFQPIFPDNSSLSTASQSTVASNGSSTDNYIDLQYFDNVNKIIQDKYIGDIPTKQALTYGAIKGVVNSLGNQYNSFLTPDEAKQYLDSRNPNIEGIGVTLKYNGQDTEIETTLQNYPAQKAGLKTGDIIYQVDSDKVLGQMPNDVANKIKGPSGTTVDLKVLRKVGSDVQTLDFPIKREKIQIDNISYEDLGNGYFKVNIIQFLGTTADDLNALWDKTVTSIKNTGKPVKGIIVDLRGNPGGYVFSVRYILEDFLKKDTVIMGEQEKNQTQTTYKVTRDGRFTDVPMVVLVNEGSASASEIFATSIQDNGRGKVIGEPTVGKGVEQQVMNLDDNSMLIIVFQKWLTPKGRNITKQTPVSPDQVVQQKDDDTKKGIDTQLEAAKQALGISN